MRAYSLTLLALWIAGGFAAYSYSVNRGIPADLALPAGLAMLVELSCYAALAFKNLREWAARQSAFWLVVSAAVPFLLYSAPAGAFRWSALFALMALACIASFWYRILPPHPLSDLVFLAVMAAAMLAKVFDRIYLAPSEHVDIAILGQLMWIRLGIFAALEMRRFEGIGFGFLPDRREWWIGLRYYVYFMPVGAALAFGLRFARFDPATDLWWRLPLTFLGVFWVVALSEEFFFRGMLQPVLARYWGTTAGLLATSLAFGAVHLPFRQFPNWEFAALAAVAGLFYGRAYLQGQGIRAAMVTHALVVATWRTLLR